MGYSAVNLARSVLSSMIKPENGITFGENPLVCRLLKGIFNIKPSLPRYTVTWDVGKIFQHIKSLPSLEICNLKTISYRLAILLCLTTGQRDQTISYLHLDLMKFENDKVILFVPELIKTSRPGHHLEPIVLIRYNDREICVMTHLEKYKEITKEIRTNNKLLISFQKPHKPITTSTLSRWCVSMLQQAGIDITVFGSHSTRSASTSHCRKKGLCMKEINKAAGWASEKTFAKFYNKPIQGEQFSSVIYKK